MSNSVPVKFCQACSSPFEKPETTSKKRWSLRAFCSTHCANSRPSTIEGKKVEGIEHGTITGYSTHACRCFECRNAAKLYRQRSRAGDLIPKDQLGLKEEANPAWKGDDASYGPIHSWVARHKTKTGICSRCEKDAGTTGRGGTHWANVDHEYRRDLDDFIELCPSCHKKYDLEHNLGKRALACSH